MSLQILEQQQAPAQALENRDANFLRQNWKMVLGNDCNERLRYVRAGNGALSITNGKVLLRSPAPQNLPDGFYLIDQNNCFVPSTKSVGWMGYPDVETCRPRFDQMKPSVLIPADVIKELIHFTEIARRKGEESPSHNYMNRVLVLMDRSGFWLSSDTSFSFKMPFENFPTGEEVPFDPLTLKMGLVEMLRYQGVYFSREDRRGERSPLVIGLDWGHCAVVMPVADSYGYRVNYNN